MKLSKEEVRELTLAIGSTIGSLGGFISIMYGDGGDALCEKLNDIIPSGEELINEKKLKDYTLGILIAYVNWIKEQEQTQKESILRN